MNDPHANLSSWPVPAALGSAERLPATDQIVYEKGPIQLSDTSQGLDYQLWRARLVGDTVYLTSPTKAETPLFSLRGVTQISLSFDQNGHPLLAYLINSNEMWLFWYDPVIQSFTHTLLENEVRDVRVILPDRRKFQLAYSEVGVYYTKNDALYWRRQLERYQHSHLLLQGIGGRLLKVGMSTHYRLQFIFQAHDYDTYSCTLELGCL